MKKLIGLLIFFLVYSISSGQTVNYVESFDIIPNPERGFYAYTKNTSDYATTIGANNLSVSFLTGVRNYSDKVTIIIRNFFLDAFMTSDINSIYLNNIQKDYDNARAAGIKVITIFAYSDVVGTTPQQPTKAQILKHISQLAPILKANKDVIFSVQAGLIGTWGEWYFTNSDEFGTNGTISSSQWANRKQVVDSLLKATPIEIPLQVRYVEVKKKLYGTSQLSPISAYQNTPNARIGFFDDAFLNNYGDMGTYSIYNECLNPVGTPEYNYLTNETNYLPMTAETNGINPCDNGYRTSGENVVYEMGLTNLTSINRGFYAPFWDQVASNYYTEIVNKLGYRFVLKSTVLKTNNLELDLNIMLANIGFARPFKKRNVYLVLKNTVTNDTSIQLVNTDIRTWDSLVAISQKFSIKSPGKYKLYLWMPDYESSLAKIPNFSIQFANNNIWDATTGFNDLLQTVTLAAPLVAGESLLNNTNFLVYENPASDFIRVQFNSQQKETVQIFSTLGELVKEDRALSDQKIDISDLPDGVYYLSMNDNKHLVAKLIKQ